MVKIVDVAKEAGVSKSTVSRVLNNDKSVNEKTRALVTEVIKRMNYSPSYFAQGIRTRKTNTIALLVPEYSNFFYAEMFRGAEDVALKNKYMILVCSTLSRSISEIDYIRALLRRSVDGIIYNTYSAERDTIEYLKEVAEKIPVVLMNKTISDHPGFSYVYTDGYESTRNAVKYLFERGKRKIGYIRNAQNISITDDRFEGYLQGLRDCGLMCDKAHLYQIKRMDEPDYIRLGRLAGAQIAAQKERPDAVLSAIDMLAIGCIKELQKNGVRVPEEISVVGFDNISLGELIEPELTTIAQPTRELGQKATELLIGKIGGKQAEDHVKFEGKLIVRNSTD